MEESIVYSNVADELLEIIKYLEENIKSRIPEKLIMNLNLIRNKEHNFKIDKTCALMEQKVLPETFQALSILYLKYCCNEKERGKALLLHKEFILSEEQKKNQKYDINNIFNNPVTIKKEQKNNVELIKIEDEYPWYKKILIHIRDFLNKLIDS